MKDDVDPNDFVHDAYSWAVDNLNEGNFFVDQMTDYESLIDDTYRQTVGGKMYFTFILSAFFLINVVLGSVGTMWLQTRRRIRETGVLRSFGATNTDIIRMLIGESIVLYTAAFIIADLVCMQFGYRFGLGKGYDIPLTLNLTDSWLSHFWVHFGVLSAIVYAIMLVCVLLGTYFPARKLSHISPVDALRYE